MNLYSLSEWVDAHIHLYDVGYVWYLSHCLSHDEVAQICQKCALALVRKDPKLRNLCSVTIKDVITSD